MLNETTHDAAGHTRLSPAQPLPRPPPTSGDPAEAALQTTMRVKKRDGSTEPVDVNKIVRAVSRSCHGLREVDPLRVATRTISGLYDGATTKELDELSIRTAAQLIAEEPQYSKLAARLLSTFNRYTPETPHDAAGPRDVPALLPPGRLRARRVGE